MNWQHADSFTRWCPSLCHVLDLAFVVCRRRIRRGEVLCRVPALAGVPHPMVLQAGKSCAECLGPIPSAVAGAQPSSQCENCEVQYCSAACATTASSNWHPAACHKRESWHVLDEGVATLRKHPMLLQRLLAASLCSPLGFEAYWDAVGLLTSSWVASDEPPPSMVARQEALKADLAGCVGGEVDKLFETALTPQWYSGVFGLLQRNAFAVPVSGVPVGQEGTALWLGVSLLNHSCEPSADITFDAGPTAVLTARCDLAIDDELTIAYIDCNAPREDRHKALATYGFNCKCPRCVAEDQ